MITRFLVTLAGLAAITAMLGGCSSEPVDVAGEYSLAVTNGQNGCNFSDWVEGETSTNIPVSVIQDDTRVTAEVQGLVGGFLSLWLGTNVYDGDIDGSSLELILFGSNSTTTGNCTYTINSTLQAEFDNDVLSGQILYEAATNGNPDCVGLEGCATIQSFNGVRPPQ